MDLVFWKIVATITALIAFVLVCWWAYDPRNRERFIEDGDIVIETDPILSKQEHAHVPANLDVTNREKP